MEERIGDPRPRRTRTGTHSRRFTYLDYLELRAWEFEKFRSMPPLSDEEIAAVDWKSLFRQLAR